MSADAEARRARGLYIAFPESPPRDSTFSRSYAEAVLREAKTLLAGAAPRGPLVARMAGGEPWRLADRDLLFLFRGLARLFPEERRAERSIEWIAAEAKPARLDALRRSGFDRICLTGETRASGYRPARAEGTAEAVRAAREAGFRRVAVDVDPFVGDADLLRPSAAAAAGADHVSLVEEGADGPPEDLWLARYDGARRVLEEAGLLRYETFSFARPGRRSAGLLLISAGGDWAGVGAGAVSTDPGERRRNESDPERYLRAVRRGGEAVLLREARGGEDRFLERVLHGLRRPAGLSIGALAARFGAGRVREMERRAQPLLREGLLIRRGNRLLPTERGLLTAEGAVRSLFTGNDEEK